VLGVHLEGPYINAGKLGAQTGYARPFDAAELARLHAIAPIRAGHPSRPEVPGPHGCRDGARRRPGAGYKCRIGHTLGSYEEGVEALGARRRRFTHLFNAMTALHHREPGMVGAALAHARYSELIPDLLHAHPGAIRVALRAIPCLYCVTDSTAAPACPTASTSSAATASPSAWAACACPTARWPARR
jgi:N-acetylglucosamine-6-phosphate deacetylase